MDEIGGLLMKDDVTSPCMRLSKKAMVDTTEPTLAEELRVGDGIISMVGFGRGGGEVIDLGLYVCVLVVYAGGKSKLVFRE